MKLKNFWIKEKAMCAQYEMMAAGPFWNVGISLQTTECHIPQHHHPDLLKPHVT